MVTGSESSNDVSPTAAAGNYEHPISNACSEPYHRQRGIAACTPVVWGGGRGRRGLCCHLDTKCLSAGVFIKNAQFFREPLSIKTIPSYFKKDTF